MRSIHIQRPDLRPSPCSLRMLASDPGWRLRQCFVSMLFGDNDPEAMKAQQPVPGHKADVTQDAKRKAEPREMDIGMLDSDRESMPGERATLTRNDAGKGIQRSR